MKQSSRAVALEVLSHGGDAAGHLDRALRAADLAPRDRAFATELAYGTLKMRRSLEWAVQQFLNRPLAQLEPELRDVLLLGAYQLMYLDRVPAHGAVDESVSLARAHGHAGTAAVANAVLRKIAAQRPRPPRPTVDAGAGALGVYASLPDWIAAHLIERFGFEVAVAAAEGMNGPPRRALRVDVAQTPLESLSESVSGAGAAVHAGRYGIPECLIVQSAGTSGAVRDAVEAGGAVWQSEESQLAVHLLDPRPGEVILDVCAGRGTKTLMIARRLAGRGAVWSIDDDERRLCVLQRVAQRADARNVEIVCADARARFPDPVPDLADAALVDAPCSGLGAIGRQPDARWRKHEGDPSRFARAQSAILTQAASRVRPGGRLLYVTCSTHAAEDEEVVEAFLAANARWRAEPLPLRNAPSLRQIGPYALTIPGIEGSDGFFYALLRRGGNGDATRAGDD